MEAAKAIKQLYTGKMVNLFDPQPHDIDAVDMAHALSLANRFGGHTRWPYSVAQHCVLAADLATRLYNACREDVLACLVHDGSETYVGDMIAPLKAILGMAAYRTLEDRWHHTVAMRFGIQYPWRSPMVKEIDLLLLVTEARDLMSEPECPWPGALPEPLEDFEIVPWERTYAKDRYWAALKELCPLLVSVA